MRVKLRFSRASFRHRRRALPVQWLNLAAAVVNDADGRTETQFDGALADGEGVLRIGMPPPTTELMFT